MSLYRQIKKIVKKYYHEKKGKHIMHMESPHFNTDSIIKYCKKYKPKCYCITPVNYEFVKYTHWTDLGKKEYEEFLIKLYKKLLKIGINLQLHVHISHPPETASREIKKFMITSAYNFFKNKLNIKPTEIVLGWFAVDYEIEEICNSLNLKVIGWSPYIYDSWCKKMLK